MAHGPRSNIGFIFRSLRRLDSVRRGRQVSQAELAKRLGKTRAWIAKLESGRLTEQTLKWNEYVYALEPTLACNTTASASACAAETIRAVFTEGVELSHKELADCASYLTDADRAKLEREHLGAYALLAGRLGSVGKRSR